MPEASLRYACRREDEHVTVETLLVAQEFWRVAGGLRVRHRHDRGKTAALRGGDAGGHVLRLGHPRVAEMDVDVDESWKV